MAEVKTCLDILQDLSVIASELRAQDNAYTADPIFMVEARVVTYGMDPDYADDHEIAWLDESAEWAECDAKRSRRIERLWRESSNPKVQEKIRRRYTRTAKTEHWQYVQPFLTRAGAEGWIERNAHEHPDGLRVFVKSAHRNAEWKLIRQAVLSLGSEEFCEAVRRVTA